MKLDRLFRKLDSLGGNMQESLKRGVHQATKLVQGDAKLLAPVAEIDGGRLENSIQGEVHEEDGQIIGKVSTNVEYAHYVEFGTGQRGEASNYPGDVDLSYRQDWAGMAAQPYLYPAIKQNEKEIKEIIAESVKREIKRLGG